MVAKKTESKDKRVEEGTEALKDLKKYLKSANIQDEENWRLRALLNRLGLTKYESEAYIGLVQGGTLTVKQLVQKTGIPQSRSYDTLGSLVKYGMVEQTPLLGNNGLRKEKRFRPVEPDVAVQNLFSYYTYAKDEAIAALQKIKVKKNKSSNVWEIHGKKNITQTAKNLFKRAEHEVFIIAKLRLMKEMEEEMKNAIDRGINITCIINHPDLEYEFGLKPNEFLHIKTHIGFPMPNIIRDHQQALVWGQDTFNSDIDEEYVVAQLIESREWVSTLADHFFLSRWNRAKPKTADHKRENIILPKTFVHIHTALAEATYLLQNNIIPYAVVDGRDKEGTLISLSGEIVKIRKEWSEGISTIIIRPDDSEKDTEITIGGKYALYEDVRMDKILIDKKIE